MGERRLLAIDDDESFRQFLEDLLADTGYRTVIAGNAAAFKQAYAELDPTVVVLDMVMPDVDGFELMQWLIDQGYTSKVVLITGFSTRYAEMAAKLGADHGLTEVITLSKPVRTADLRDALDIS